MFLAEIFPGHCFFLLFRFLSAFSNFQYILNIIHISKSIFMEVKKLNSTILSSCCLKILNRSKFDRENPLSNYSFNIRGYVKAYYFKLLEHIIISYHLSFPIKVAGTPPRTSLGQRYLEG